MVTVGVKVAVLGTVIGTASAWLAELRRLTVLFVNLPDMNVEVPLEQAQQAMRALQDRRRKPEDRFQPQPPRRARRRR